MPTFATSVSPANAISIPGATAAASRSGSDEGAPGGPQVPSAFLPLGPVHVSGLAEEHFGRLHDRFGQRRMRMNRQLEVRRVRAHFDCQHALRNQFAGARSNQADAEETFGL